MLRLTHRDRRFDLGAGAVRVRVFERQDRGILGEEVSLLGESGDIAQFPVRWEGKYKRPSSHRCAPQVVVDAGSAIVPGCAACNDSDMQHAGARFSQPRRRRIDYVFH